MGKSVCVAPLEHVVEGRSRSRKQRQRCHLSLLKMQRRGRSASTVPSPLPSLDPPHETVSPHSYWHLCVPLTQHSLLTSQQYATLYGALQVLGAVYISPSGNNPFRGVLGPLQRSKPSLEILGEADKLHLKLASVLAFVVEVDKQRTPLSTYSSLLCCLLREFRAGLLAVAVASPLDTVLDLCVEMLKHDKAHTALLMVVEHVNAMRQRESLSGTVCTAVREVFLPLLVLLKGAGEGPQLEVVERIEELVSQPDVQTALKNYKTTNVCTVPSITSADFAEFVGKGQEAELFEKLGNALSTKTERTKIPLKVRKTLLHRRCNSVTEKTASSPICDLGTIPSLFPGLLHDSARSPPPTPFFPQLSEIYEESMRDDISESHDVPVLLPSPRFLQSSGVVAPIAALTGDEVVLEQSDGDGSIVHEHPYMSNFLDILSLEQEPDTPPTWELVCSRPNVTVYKKKADNTPVCMIKAYCLLDHPPEVVFKAMVDVEVRMKWDKLFSELAAFDPHPFHDYLYYVVKVTYAHRHRSASVAETGCRSGRSSETSQS